MSKSVRFWNRIAEKYAQSPIKDMKGYEATLARVRTHLTPDDHLLELGCGTGSTAILLAGDAGQITATDYAGEMVAIGQRKAAEAGVENVTFLQADPFDPVLVPGAYDVVMGMNFYHLLDDMPAGLARSFDLVKPGGYVIAKTPCLGDAPFFKRLMLKSIVGVLQLVGKAPSVGFVTGDTVEAQMKAAGLEIVERSVTAGMVPRDFIIARRPS